MQRYAWTLGPVLVLLAAIGLASVVGVWGREAPKGDRDVQVDTASDVLAAVSASGARGSTLVLFDKYINTMDKDERYQYWGPGLPEDATFATDETNLTTALISAGLIRRVIVILPDSEWLARRDYFESAWDVFPLGGTGYRFRFAGEPIDIYAASNPPASPPGERAIAVIDAALEASYPRELVERWTSPEAASLVIRQGN